MIETKIRIINRIVAEALSVGDDAGGPYDATSKELENYLRDWMIQEGIVDEYITEVTDVVLPCRTFYGADEKSLRAVQIVKKDESEKYLFEQKRNIVEEE